MTEKSYCITFTPILESGQPDILNCQQLFIKLPEKKAESLKKMFSTDKNLGFISTIEEFILN